MEKFLPFHIPEIGREEIEAVVETLRSSSFGSQASPSLLDEGVSTKALAEED